MSDRRRFLIQGGLATTAMLAAKPVNAVTQLSTWFPSLLGKGNAILLLHTNIDIKGKDHFSGIIHKIQNSERNAFWVDASMLEDQPYKIVKKGNVQIGLIGVGKSLKNLGKVSSLATKLKMENNCHLVVCLSGLGYKGKKKDEDLKLAKLSENVDVILGGFHNNSIKKQNIVLNRNKSEVIINHSAHGSLAISGIKIGFDNNGRKNHIEFNNRLS